MSRSRLLSAILFALALFPVSAEAWEVIITKTGETVEGVVVKETEEEVTVNIYFSAIPGMEYELRVLAKKMIAKRQTKDRPFETYLTKRAAIKADDADGHYQLSVWCKEQKLAAEMNDELQAALDIQPDHKDARAALGDSKADKYLADRKKEKEVFRPLEEKYVACEDQKEQKSIYAELKKQGYKNPQHYLDRIARSMKQTKGQTTDVRLTLLSDKVPGVYTLYVPESYDPWKPYPLVLGLHGGGAAGKAGEFVNGTGKDTMPFYSGPAAKKNWIVVCPNALRAPWRETENEALLEACLKEIELSFNVDLNRVYLVGHSMGGWGTWHFGPKWCDRFAAISPNSGGGSNGIAQLVKTQTPIYFYHGADDNVCPVPDSRQAAKSLKKSTADFVYTELPTTGHGFPGNVVDDIFNFFDLKRLAVQGGGGKSAPFARSLGARSSFLMDLTPEETKYLAKLGATGDSAAAGASKTKGFVEQLSLGGRNGEEAAKKLIELADKTTLRPLSQVLLKGTSADARKFAADVLAEIGDKSVVQPLCQALADADLAVRAAVARALGKIAEPKVVPALLQALDAQGKELESKKTKGNEIEDADWEKNLDVLGWLTWSLGKLGAGDKRVHTGIVNICATKVLLADVVVPHDNLSSYEDPKTVSERFCLVVITALKELGQSTTAETVKKLMARFPACQPVQDAGKEALEKLGSTPE
ncbi:MAG: HEAT repeat domain-containing protein [Planctomycetota bacterium]|nr:HEAT repeat domain-containing protein [Planctomycetota bacterium]